MLKLKDLTENFDLARAALRNWKHDEDTLEDCFQYFRISSNGVYPFRQEGRLCFLRLAPTAEKLRTNIEGELEFILYLRENGYPALEPMKAENGRYLLTLQTAWGDYFATAFYGVAGDSIEDSGFSEKTCHEYGKALGRLHALSQGFVPTVKKQTHEDLLDLMEKRLVEFHCAGKLFDVLAELRRELRALPKDSDSYGLVHYDFECDNVFYDAETGSCNVIDFDDGIYHFYALDIEQALDSLYEEAPEDRCEVAAAAFLAGYQTAFPYSEATESMRPVMRRFCDLHSYVKLLYCLSGPAADQPDWMAALESKLTDKAEYLKRKLCAE